MLYLLPILNDLQEKQLQSLGAQGSIEPRGYTVRFKFLSAPSKLKIFAFNTVTIIPFLLERSWSDGVLNLKRRWFCDGLRQNFDGGLVMVWVACCAALVMLSNRMNLFDALWFFRFRSHAAG